MEFAIAFYFLLFLIAFLYSSVGHGGASGYLALMAIFSVTPEIMKPTALLLNLFVSLLSFIHFYRGGYFNFRLFWPFAVTSVPMAYIGGQITIEASMYKHMLGVFLLIPAARFMFRPSSGTEGIKKSNFTVSLIVGALIGFFSGLIGIGGGIILSPLLLLLNWANMKTTAAISALFIFVNSLAGLTGQFSKDLHFSPEMIAYTVVALLGGIGGAYFGSSKLNERSLRFPLAIVLIIASYKLLFSGA